MKRALVVSGGGAKGSFAGGIIENLIKLKKIDWDIFVASSTGSLIIPSTSIKDIDKLKEQYTSVDNSSIYSISPFKQNGKLKIFNAVWRLITRKNSLGNASRLRKKIEQIFTEEDFKKSIALGKQLYICVSNISMSKPEFKLQSECTYKDFCDWMFASCSVPIAFEVVKKNNNEYVDGGVFHMIPIQQAIDAGADEIDVIILKEKNPKPDGWKSKGLVSVFMRVIDEMNIEISRDDISIAQLSGQQKNIKINFYYTPYKLTNNSIVFNKAEMIKWWKMGYEFDKNKNGDIKSNNELIKEEIYNEIKLCKSKNKYIINEK